MSKSKMQKKTLLGIKKNILFSGFLLKFVLMGILSGFFFFDFGAPKHYVLVLVIILNILLLQKHCFKIVPFLLLSTVVISLVWWIIKTPFSTAPITESLQLLLETKEYTNAMYTLWGGFLTGQLFLGITSQYEIIEDLKRLKANNNVILFVIILFNSVAYFIETYKAIKKGLFLRLKSPKKLSSVFYVFYTLMFDAISIIIECKKAFWLNQERVYHALSRKSSVDYCSESPLDIENLKINITAIRYADTEKNIVSETEITLKKGVSLLVGDNGCGKTTLFQGITKLIPEIINGVSDISFECSSSQFTPQNIGYVMQGVESTFLYDNVEKALSHLPPEVATKGLDAFNMTYLMDGEKPISELSAGECKIIALLGILLDPKYSVILLDEPTMFLAEPLKDALFTLLESVGQQKILLVITHDQSMLKAFSTVFRLSSGKITEGTPAHFSLPEISLEKRCATNSIWNQTLSIPQPLCFDMLDSSKKASVKSKDLTLSSGMNLGIAGPNGAGKTTLGIFICEKIKAKGTQSAVMLLQDLNKQFFTATVLDELLFGVSKTKENTERATRYLDYMGISSLASVPPQFISGGEKRLVLIGTLLMQDADVIILDEPFDSLDNTHVNKLITLLCEHQKKTNCAYIFIDQSFDLYDNLSDETIEVHNFKITSK